ncbi:MAG TPA: lipase secretion chaperone [Noviherbaspirillum sp.]
MRQHRLLWIVLVAAATAAAYSMQSPPQQEPVRLTAGDAPHTAGSLYANPFSTGAHAAPVQPDTQPAVAGETVFAVGSNGELFLDADTRSRLDVLIGALPAAATRYEIQAMEASALVGLPPQARQKAARLLDGYLRYQKAEAELNAAFANEAGSGTEQMLDKLAALRRQYLGAEAADAFFAEHEAQERYHTQLVRLEADGALTAREKLARIEAMQRELPATADGLQGDLATARASWALEQGVAELRQQGAPEDRVRQLREQYVGADGAKSISEMESQKLEWQQRQYAFSQQREAIARMNLSEQQKQERIEALLSQIYSAEEIPAARAFHQLQAQR